jgi:NADH-quinone oxidoreductase subunit N
MEFSLKAMLPEIFLATMACVILVFDLYISDRYRRLTYVLSQVTLLVAAVLAICLWDNYFALMDGHFITDKLAVVLKTSIFIVGFGIFAYVYDYLREREIRISEYYILGLFSLLGMSILVSAGSLLTVYLGLELLSLPLYAMVAMIQKRATASEAAMKYFVMGALASGMLLFGISLVYGATGQIHLDALPVAMSMSSGQPDLILLLGVVFLVIGIGFKFGAVPFHMWIPDVYAGSLNPIVMFVATAPKIAAFGMMARILWDMFGVAPETWQSFILIMAVLSLLLGNVAAIAQTNIKRLLGYSTIGHVGFIFLAIYAGSFAAGAFYVLSYALMTLAAFGILVVLSQRGIEIENISDLAGLDKQHRWLAVLMLLVLFSLAGVPPSIGFYAKFVVLAALVDVNLVWLAIFGLVMSVIAAFYYLRVVKAMYFDEPTQTREISIPHGTNALLSINTLATWALGIAPGGLMAVCLLLF